MPLIKFEITQSYGFSWRDGQQITHQIYFTIILKYDLFSYKVLFSKEKKLINSKFVFFLYFYIEIFL